MIALIGAIAFATRKDEEKPKRHTKVIERIIERPVYHKVKVKHMSRRDPKDEVKKEETEVKKDDVESKDDSDNEETKENE